MKARFLLALLFCCLSALPAVAADQAVAVNTVCPVTGKPVDSNIPPVVVTVGKGERAKRLVIGVADRASAEQVKSNPSAYVDAARANRKAP